MWGVIRFLRDLMTPGSSSLLKTALKATFFDPGVINLPGAIITPRIRTPRIRQVMHAVGHDLPLTLAEMLKFST